MEALEGLIFHLEDTCLIVSVKSSWLSKLWLEFSFSVVA